MLKVQKESQSHIALQKTEQLEDNKLFEDNQMDQEESKRPSSKCKVCIQKSFQKSNQNNLNMQKTIFDSNSQKGLLIFSCLILMTSVLAGTFFYKQVLEFSVLKLGIIEKQKHFKGSNLHQIKDMNRIGVFFNSSGLHLKKQSINICPNKSSTFHVYYNETESRFQSSQIDIKNQLILCKLPILGKTDLQKLIQHWNERFSQLKILLRELQSQQEKQILLVLLKLYFSGGTYINITIPYPKIQNRCWKYILTGTDTLFIEAKQKNQFNIQIPNPNTFMKVRFPFSPLIKSMLEKLINKQDFLQKCRQSQCLIVKCLS